MADRRQTEPAETPSGADKEDAGSDHSEMVVYVGLPLIIAVFLALIALLLLLVYFILRAKNKRQKYSKVPHAESRLTNLSSLPYPSIKPPSIKIEGVPSPDMTFTVAPQLPSPASSQRYPFIKHKGQQNRTIQAQERRQQRLKRSKNDHAASEPSRPDSGTHSLSSGSPDHSPVRQRGKGKEGERKTSVISLSQFGDQHPVSQAFMVPAGSKQVSRSLSTSSDKPPEISLTLTYLKEKTTLVVSVEKVVGLPPRDDGAEVDAYVRLFFIPRLPEMAQRKTSKTRTAKKELDPVFHEQIYYEAMSEEELINSTLHVQVLDYRAYGRHQIIGRAELSLGHVTVGEDGEPVLLQLLAPRVRLQD